MQNELNFQTNITIPDCWSVDDYRLNQLTGRGPQ